METTAHHNTGFNYVAFVHASAAALSLKIHLSEHYLAARRQVIEYFLQQLEEMTPAAPILPYMHDWFPPSRAAMWILRSAEVPCELKPITTRGETSKPWYHKVTTCSRSAACCDKLTFRRCTEYVGTSAIERLQCSVVDHRQKTVLPLLCLNCVCFDEAM